MTTPGNAPAPTPVEAPGEISRPSIGEQISRFPGTFGLIAFTLIIFAGQFLSSQLTGIDLVLEYGAKSKIDIVNGDLWRLATPMFVHVGLMHLFVNMYSLYAIGPAVERFFLTARFIIIYVLAGIGGIALSLALSPYPSAGASGAIFGLLGALGTFLYIHREVFGRLGRLQLRQIVLVAILNFALVGLVPRIDHWGHLGGLITGMLLAWIVGPRYEIVWDDWGGSTYVDRQPLDSVWPRVVVATGAVIAVVVLSVMSPVGA